MLYKQKHCSKWWVMFRDPNRPGRFFRKSTGTSDHAKALQIEAAMKLSLHAKLEQKSMERILRAVYGSEEALHGMRFSEIWDNYTRVLRQRGSVQKDKTADQVRKNVDDVISWAVEKKGLRVVRELSSMLAFEYAEILKRTKSAKTGKPLKDKSRKNYIANLSSVWTILSGIEPEIGNPWRNLQPTVKDAQRHGTFTRDQEAAILAAASASADPTWETLCLIARHTGLRKGDVVHLRFGSVGGMCDTKDMKHGLVDMSARIIKTPPSKTERYGIIVVTPMVTPLFDALNRFVARLPKPPKEGAWLFPDFVRAYPNDPVLPFSDILKAAGIVDDTLTFHSYRHTFRTRLKEAGVPDDVAKMLGGWTQDKTLARYDHADQTEAIREQLERAT